MADVDESADVRARLDEVRRRLYRPDATAADHRRYGELQDELARAVEVQRARAEADRTRAEQEERERVEDQERTRPAHDQRPEPPAPGSRRRLLLPAALVVGVVAASIAVGASQAAPNRLTPTARPDAASSAAGSPAPSASAGVSARFQDDAAPVPSTTAFTVQTGGDPVVAQRTSGSGDAEVAIDVADAPPSGGRLVVVLTSSDPSPVGWRAERRAVRTDHSPYTQVVGASTPALREGAAVTERVDYRGEPPTRLAVQAPTGTGWTLTVAFAGRTPRR